MAITLEEAVKRYNNPVASGVAANIIETAPLYNMIPWTGINGNAYKHVYEGTLGGVAFGQVNTAIPASAKTDSSVQTKLFDLKQIHAEAHMDKFVEKTSASAGQNPMAYQMASKSKQIGRVISGCLVGTNPTGLSSVTGRISGLPDLVNSGQVFDGAGDVTATKVRKLISKVKSKSGKCDVLVCSEDMHLQLLELLDSRGGNTRFVSQANPFLDSTRQVLMFDGVPVIVNDYMSLTEAATGEAPLEDGYVAGTKQSIWAVAFDDGSKQVGLSFLYPSASSAGIEVDQLGTSQTHNAYGVRLNVALETASFNEYAVARMYNLSVKG